jgi:four helix bundle protein
MPIVKFEDLIAWKKSQDLALEIYGTFKDLKDWGFKDQICRAVISISNNIAEGFDRHSPREFKRFLYISTGSASEVKSMLYLAERLSFIDKNKANQLISDVNEVSKIIYGLIKSVESK